MNRMLGAAVMCLVLLAGAASPAWAQTYRRENRRANYARRYDDNRRYNDRSVWERSRDKLTVAGGAGVGALIGGLAGGKKGALIGAGAGGGGAALYTYGIRNRNRRY